MTAHTLRIEEAIRHQRREVKARCTCGWRKFGADMSLVMFADEAAIHKHFKRPPVEGGKR